MIRQTFPSLACALALAIAGGQAAAQSAPATPAAVAVGRVVISGSVPDEATKAALLARLHEVYGSGQVVDQIAVGGVVAPANWSSNIPKLLNQNLRAISKGQIAIDGTNISMRGEVGSETIKQNIASDFAGALNPTYTVKNGLRVTASSQTVLDQTLANRVIEFERGSAMLTESGKRILDEMSDALKKVNARKIDIIGHTDDKGARAHNAALSLARAESVKIYLVARGLPAETIGINGMGADQPIVSNATEEGRQRNRRIEFRVSQ